MAKVRYVIMVPTVVEEDIVEAVAAEHGRFVAGNYPPVASLHPSKGDENYPAFVVEACVTQPDDKHLHFAPVYQLEEFIAPGAA